MESEKVTVKVEPLDEAAEGGNEEPESQELVNGPEFVNIKSEIDIEVTKTRIKKEVEEDEDGEGSSETRRDSWEVPVVDGVDPSQCIEVSIKEEPGENHVLLNHGSPLPSTSNHFNKDPEFTPPGARYVCPICSKAFANTSNVQRHMLIHTRQNHKCETCGVVFVDKEKFDKHVLNKHISPKVKTYPCDSCEKVFKSSSNLMQHKKTHLDVKPYQCSLCYKTFSFKSNLIKHEGKRRCHPAKTEPLICVHCNKTFEKDYLLKSHLIKHETERPFSCEQCSITFKYKSALSRHMQLHEGKRPFSCPVCNKTFTSSGLLKPHLRVHTGEKPYQCPVCSKMFAHKHNMLRHSLRHNKIKHVVCKVCHKQFPKESRLKYHMKTHINEKHFACSICPKRFSHRQNILRHYTRKHPGKTYTGTDTDATVALKVWDSFKCKYGEEEAEEILG